MSTTRINKFLAASGVCSRREADRLIAEGKVTINGRTAVLGDPVEETDTVTYDGKTLQKSTEFIYLAFNKPFGVITTTDKNSENNIMDYIDIPERVFPIGRLDVESSGLILLTNDGDIVNKILRSENKFEKEYMVSVDQPITPTFLERLEDGVRLGARMTLPSVVRKISAIQFTITIIQGMYRQIRRMCEACGYEVTILSRTRVGSIKLGDLPRGKYRYLTPEEIADLKELKNTSSQTERDRK